MEAFLCVLEAYRNAMEAFPEATGAFRNMIEAFPNMAEAFRRALERYQRAMETFRRALERYQRSRQAFQSDKNSMHLKKITLQNPMKKHTTPFLSNRPSDADFSLRGTQIIRVSILIEF